MELQFRVYLGDSVYVGFDGYHVVLTTENGIEATNKIFLDPSVLRNLDEYREALKLEIMKEGSDG